MIFAFLTKHVTLYRITNSHTSTETFSYLEEHYEYYVYMRVNNPTPPTHTHLRSHQILLLYTCHQETH